MFQSSPFPLGTVCRIATALCASVLLPTLASAHPILIDQTQPYVGGGVAFIASNDIGQTFTPTLDRLDAVDLWLMDTGPGNGVVNTLAVRIFELDGTLLGSSAPQVFGEGYGGGVVALTHFDLAPIALIPGTKYIIGFDLTTTGAFTDLGIGGYLAGTYAGGGFYRFSTGIENQTADLAFAEGPAFVQAPEPASMLIFGVAALGFAARRRLARNS